MAVLPGGGANVFARSLGLPRDAVEAAGVLLERLHEPPRRVPLGRAGDRWFLANAGVGIDAAIVRRVEEPAVRQAHGRRPVLRVVGAPRAVHASTTGGPPHLRVTMGDDGRRGRAHRPGAERRSLHLPRRPRPSGCAPRRRSTVASTPSPCGSLRTTLVARVLLRALRSGSAGTTGGRVRPRPARWCAIEADVPDAAPGGRRVRRRGRGASRSSRSPTRCGSTADAAARAASRTGIAAAGSFVATASTPIENSRAIRPGSSTVQVPDAARRRPGTRG